MISASSLAATSLPATVYSAGPVRRVHRVVPNAERQPAPLIDTYEPSSKRPAPPQVTYTRSGST